MMAMSLPSGAAMSLCRLLGDLDDVVLGSQSTRVGCFFCLSFIPRGGSSFNNGQVCSKKIKKTESSTMIEGPRIESSPAPVEEVRVTLKSWKQKRVPPPPPNLNADAAEWIPPCIPSAREEEEEEEEVVALAREEEEDSLAFVAKEEDVKWAREEEKSCARSRRGKLSFVTGNPALGEDAFHFGVIRLTTAPENNYALSNAFSARGGAPLPVGTKTTSCVALLGVPSRFVACDILEVLAPWRSTIRHLRVARHCEPPTWPAKLAVVLLKLKSIRAAEDLYEGLHGRPFNSFEQDRCNLAFVDGLKWTSSPSSNSDKIIRLSHTNNDDLDDDDDDDFAEEKQESFWCAAENQNAVCVVCLEKIIVTHHNGLNTTLSTDDDDDVQQQQQQREKVLEQQQQQQLFTTACDHTFHTDCLSRWRDAPCPVCRYDHAGAQTTFASVCDACASSRHLWVCLLCGYCGCEADHALEHFEGTKHAYAINVDHRHVWDFVGEGYVHRLVDNSPSDDDHPGTTKTLEDDDDALTDNRSLEVADARRRRENNNDDDLDRGSYVPGQPLVEDEDDEDEIRAIRDVLLDEGDVLVTRRRRRPGPPRFARGDKNDPKKVLWEENTFEEEDGRAYDHRKLEGLAVEYNELLRQQLAKQRDIYEAEIYEARLREIQEEDQSEAQSCREDDEQRLATLRRRRKQVDQKRAKLRAKIDDLENDLRFEDDLYQTIQADLVQWKDQLATAQADLRQIESRRDTLVPLFEQRAANLMRQLDDVPEIDPKDATHPPELRIVNPVAVEETKKSSQRRGKHNRKAKKTKDHNLDDIDPPSTTSSSLPGLIVHHPGDTPPPAPAATKKNNNTSS